MKNITLYIDQIDLAFKCMKTNLTKSSILIAADCNLSSTLHIDAFELAVRWILSQEIVEGQLLILFIKWHRKKKSQRVATENY